MNRLFVAVACVSAAACSDLDMMRSDEDLPLMQGFRASSDECRVVGENSFTNQFLDDSSTLVGCPQDYEGIGVFVTETGAIQVAESQGYTLYTVPDF
jgi:hypothetical protein